MKATATARSSKESLKRSREVAIRPVRSHHSVRAKAVAPIEEEAKAPTIEPVLHGTESSGQFRDDPVIDRRIINGMLGDRERLMTEMAEKGWNKPGVLRRAADLGFSEAFIRQVQGVAADLAGERPGIKRMPTSLGARTCLSCDRVFLSSGPANRLCMRCRGGDAGLAQL
jgi:hypothetical protein